MKLALAWPVAKHKDVHLARISAGCLVLKVFEPLVGTLHTFYHHVKALTKIPMVCFTVQLTNNKCFQQALLWSIKSISLDLS